MLALAINFTFVAVNICFSFPNYEVMVSEQSPNGSAEWRKADGEMFYKLMEDVYSMSNCDYIVCTLSSNVSMKLSNNGDDGIERYLEAHP